MSDTKDPYQEFINNKRTCDIPTGLKVIPDINPMLFDFQRDIVRWALKRGRAAIFADCGMGKTPMQLEWARHVPGRVIIVTPLAVSAQTVREACKFGLDNVKYLRSDDHKTRIVVTNYEMIEHFHPSDFTGIVLDESSILKSYTGKFRNQLVTDWGTVPFRLPVTATPAPNDFMELGNHSEFLGTMTRTDMLSQFFVHDGGDTSQWRLKGHAESDFWRWMCSWAVMIRKPSDLGYCDGGFKLPELHIHETVVDAFKKCSDTLFEMPAATLIERRSARSNSVHHRVQAVADMVNGSHDTWLVWCDLNSESAALCKAIPDAVEVKGSDDVELKEKRLEDFTMGRCRVMVTKPSIAGWGLNWQHCSHMAFTGLSDSYEQFYQAVRRCWRFGQTKPVNCYVVTASTEGAVVSNIRRKEADAERMSQMMVAHMQDINTSEIKGSTRVDKSYNANKRMEVPSWM